ncbi:scaffolding protein [Mycobacterium phage Jordennis]|uniref:Scaffolding protein n=5 Tax=Caudoviricetes TaxID=2731619 RepID=V5R3Y1_9CAUD|nr:head scaffolding protein [Mycobacterium phage CloudWang3]YP_010061242.1 head scaffolding protein [Mycobacterium phage Priamo]AMW64366.1 scaffolding protein [Mycobacterium phage Kazan]AVP42141.1 scaffolding protein [Mycobacterium phage SuperAwesome]QBP28919.1 scaffolding protein [Mycobacterium phage Jordennis]QIN93740.1 scaffolding protein [Mycobacterium phage Pmask]UAJ16347.1 scaffolding protein [Mycobacterium phage Newrala]UYL86941.1 scaffolding protein [Mycobacterium phage BABullseye]
MSDTPVSTDGTTPEGNPTPAVDKPLEPQGKVFDEAYVKSLRDEAAAARVAKKDAVDAAVNELNLKHQQELAERDTAYTELQNQLGAAWIELEKVYLSLDAKVPNDKVRAFIEILDGTDRDSIAASVQSRLELVGGFDSRTPSPAFDPSQGRGGKPPLPLNGDPILEAIKSAVGIKK